MSLDEAIEDAIINGDQSVDIFMDVFISGLNEETWYESLDPMKVTRAYNSFHLAKVCYAYGKADRVMECLELVKENM